MSKDKERSVNGDAALVPSDKQPGFFRDVWEQARLVIKLLMDPEVPIYLKVLPFAALVYLVMPFDFLPDVIPGLGQLDDLTIILVGAKVFIELAPQDVVLRHMNKLRRQDGFAPIDVSEDGQPDVTFPEDDDVIESIIIEGQTVDDDLNA